VHRFAVKLSLVFVILAISHLGIGLVAGEVEVTDPKLS
jgi:hypothetical protein